ncbi:S26 family signal peptidase [Actinomadura barringtoniae]|uniref:S26 family signal peptidase n=1 Tax=Actinomadura barringtoniae TaxID=1427535 RepID=UPI003556EC80
MVSVPDGRLLVLGDDPTGSIDSRHYGYLSGAGVLGVVIRRLPAATQRANWKDS